MITSPVARFSAAITAFLIAVSGALLAATPLAAAERAMIVLDGSGSMWGQINGEAKISIARRVLADVLGSVDSDMELGLMAYGHRVEGDCTDIEYIVEPQAGTGAAIAATAEGVRPLGKTPLTESVRQAAENLAYLDGPATVILITDGIETCNADPCALAAELEASGVDFTTHVVGFGLSTEEGRQVACLAEETGGMYLPAADADELTDALTVPLEELSAPEPVELEAEVETPDPEPIEVPEVTINVPAEVVIGSRFDVTWDGPDPDNRDAMEIFAPGAGDAYLDGHGGRRVANGDVPNRSLHLIAPIEPGPYRVKYFFGPTRIVVAEADFMAVPAPATLDAPATVDIGRPFTVHWEGPGTNQDFIYLMDLRGAGDGEQVRGVRLANGDFANQTVSIEAPTVPGYYQLQYWNNREQKVLATREIEILEAVTSITGPAEVPMGTTFIADWVGPGSNQDYGEIADLSGNRISAKRLANGDYANRKIDLVAPTEPGDYLLRYFSANNQAVLAEQALTVVPLEVSLEAAPTVIMGQALDVVWQGPGARRDSIRIITPDGDLYHSVRILNGDMANRTVNIRVPVVPGTYVLEYHNGDDNVVLATREFAVETMDVTVSGPASVPAGEPFEVQWSGPAAPRDAIVVFDPAARNGTGFPVTQTRLLSGSADTVRIRGVEEPGDYLLQYYNTDNAAVLAEVPIRVE